MDYPAVYYLIFCKMTSSTDTILRVLDSWSSDPAIADSITLIRNDPPVGGRFAALPSGLDARIHNELIRLGIQKLYEHQAKAITSIANGNNLVISTGTASGKSLCFSLPILDQLLKSTQRTALLIFPTKALSQDQYRSLRDIAPQELHTCIAIYDGDTPSHLRSEIRKRTRILLTNPDMLHNAILPHHPNWETFFRGLSVFVLDEIHLYRGIFGSHIANLIRRVKRIAHFYTNKFQFVFTSATIANPQIHAHNLAEEPFDSIEENSAPSGQKHFLLYNPPIIHNELGIRRAALSEATRLTGDLISKDVQTLLFAHTRRSVEIGLKYLRDQNPSKSERVFAYRSGYLPAERRRIEQDLKNGNALAVIATNALELGIDIGAVDAIMISGYPGSIAATRQQAGRAGRRLQPALVTLIASANPLDQYLIQHPEYLFNRSPEQALINPNNPLILLQHLRCATFELPFKENDSFGVLRWDVIAPYLEVLKYSGDVLATANRYIWRGTQYPAEAVSLRSAHGQTVLLQSHEEDRITTIGEIDRESADWMVHPQAIYLHQGQSFFVEDLDFDNNIARLTPIQCDYYTQPSIDQTIKKMTDDQRELVPGGSKHFGEVNVISQVAGFRRIQWQTHETLSVEPLLLPPRELQTMGYWIELSSEIVKTLSENNLWASAPINYGPNWENQRKLVRARDNYTCQVCGVKEGKMQHHVHHKLPFRQFTNYIQANNPENLITLCPACHRKAEGIVRVRSGLAGLRYLIAQMAPLYILCDPGDLGAHSDPQSPITDGNPVVLIYDNAPAGIGLSESLFQSHHSILSGALELAQHCSCSEGCPSCVGVSGINGVAGKPETLALLYLLNGIPLQI
jgi:DEAD/DEAH box helicase domain-containing protein